MEELLKEMKQSASDFILAADEFVRKMKEKEENK